MRTRDLEGLSIMLRVRIHTRPVLVWTTQVYAAWRCSACSVTAHYWASTGRKERRERRGSSPSLAREMCTQARRKGKLQKELVILLGGWEGAQWQNSSSLGAHCMVISSRVHSYSVTLGKERSSKIKKWQLRCSRGTAFGSCLVTQLQEVFGPRTPH